jgi:hypothetical protein
MGFHHHYARGRRLCQESGGEVDAQSIRSHAVLGERVGGGFRSLPEQNGGHIGHPWRSRKGVLGRQEDLALCPTTHEVDYPHDLNVAGRAVPHRHKSLGEVEGD